MSIASRIRELRREAGLSQRQLAEKLNVSYGTIGNYEVGKRVPDYDTLIKIADLFGVDLDYLIRGGREQKEGNMRSYAEDIDEDMAVILRAGRKLTKEEKERLRRIVECAFPHAFEAN